MTAVNSLSVKIKIKRGEYVALLGPNGAGKTTLVEMIEGIQVPDKGEIYILGKTWNGNESELKISSVFSLQEHILFQSLPLKKQ